MKVTDDSVIGMLHRTLGQLSTRASVVASNMANVDTPGYRAKRASFPEQLEGAVRLRSTDSGHIGPPRPSARDEALLNDAPTDRMRMDGNTVDLDAEMTELAALQGRYTAAAQLVRQRFALWVYTVTNGRG